MSRRTLIPLNPVAGTPGLGACACVAICLGTCLGMSLRICLGKRVRICLRECFGACLRPWTEAA